MSFMISSLPQVASVKCRHRYVQTDTRRISATNSPRLDKDDKYHVNEQIYICTSRRSTIALILGRPFALGSQQSCSFRLTPLYPKPTIPCFDMLHVLSCLMYPLYYIYLAVRCGLSP